MKKQEVISQINAGLDSALLQYEFHRIKKHNMEYSKHSGDLRYNFSFNVLENFDIKNRCSYITIEPYVSIYNKESSKILNKAYELKSPEEFYLLALSVASVRDNPGGERVILKPLTTLDIRHYPGADIKNANELLIN